MLCELRVRIIDFFFTKVYVGMSVVSLGLTSRYAFKRDSLRSSSSGRVLKDSEQQPEVRKKRWQAGPSRARPPETLAVP